MNDLGLTLPPISGGSIPQAPFPTGPAAQPHQPQQLPVRPVGRPSSDPAANELRVAKSQEVQRLSQLSPMKARDSKLLVFRVKNGRPERKPVLTLLATEIEELLQGGLKDVDEVITESLPDEIENGEFRCQWHDKQGRPVPDLQHWDLIVGDPDEQLPQEDEDLGDVPTFPTTMTMPAPAPAAPPAPAALDIAPVANALRQERNDERRNSSDMMQMILAMNQAQQVAQQNQQALMMQMQQQSQRDAEQREERERARRAEFRSTLMAMIPIILPMIQQMFGAKGMSPEMTALIEVLKAQVGAKSTDAAMLENMMRVQGKMTEQAMELQAKAAGSSAEMQA